MKCYIFRQTGFVLYDRMLLNEMEFLKWNTVFLDTVTESAVCWHCETPLRPPKVVLKNCGLFGQGPNDVEKN